MRIKLLAGLLVAGAIPFVFSSCKDDEPKKTKISFEKTEEEVNESDGTILSFHPGINASGKGNVVTVKIVLDKALADAVVVNYTVGGTALAEATDDEFNDFEIKSGINTIVGDGKFTIEKGATEATIKIPVYEDFNLEVDENNSAIETIVLTLESIASGPAELPAPITYTLSVKEDDLFVFLAWSDPDVDLDLILWDEEGPKSGSYFGSDPGDENPYELLWVPGGYADGAYGFSYPYYDGTSDDVDFGVVMYGNINNTYAPYFSESDGVNFSGNYTLANLNPYDALEDLVMTQSASKTGVKFVVGDIDIPATGSRTPSISLNQKQIRAIVKRINSNQKDFKGVVKSEIGK